MEHARRLEMRRAGHYAALLLALVLGGGCAAQIGDSCSSNGDCGTNRICDTSLPGGYCTRAECEVNDCPDEAVCIAFEDGHSFCMKYCNDDGDCRGGEYVCVQDVGDHPYCGLPFDN